jgi:hypothetical protein
MRLMSFSRALAGVEVRAVTQGHRRKVVLAYDHCAWPKGGGQMRNHPTLTARPLQWWTQPRGVNRYGFGAGKRHGFPPTRLCGVIRLVGPDVLRSLSCLDDGSSSSGKEHVTRSFTAPV